MDDAWDSYRTPTPHGFCEALLGRKEEDIEDYPGLFDPLLLEVVQRRRRREEDELRTAYSYACFVCLFQKTSPTLINVGFSGFDMPRTTSRHSCVEFSHVLK